MLWVRGQFIGGAGAGWLHHLLLVILSDGLDWSHIILSYLTIVKLQVLGLRLGGDFTFTLDSNHNHNAKDDNDNNPHLNFFKGTVLGVKEQGLGIRDKG